MKIILKQINLALLVSASVFLVFGLMFLAVGYEQMSSDTLILTAVAFPVFLALKGIEFMMDNQTKKAFLALVIFLFICLLSIIFVFV
ncbi:MAG: hypothetical protein WAO52_16490 [Prolixibacteraceae bacterium]